jgi:protoporphyrinogen oxidase
MTNIPSIQNRSSSPSSKDPRLVILGAGLAGLACACRLTESGFRNICLLEKEPFVGGLATSLHYQGHTSDLGPHRIHTEVPSVLEFLHAWAGDLLIARARRSHMFLQGKMIPYPPGLFSTLRYLGPFRLIHYMWSYILTRIFPKGASTSPETYESLMERAFGRALYRTIIKPYTEKTWGMKATNLSPDVARARVSAGGFAALARRLFLREKKGRETSLEHFLYVSGGMENLALSLQENLEERGVQFLFQSEVTGLDLSENREGIVHFIQDNSPHFLKGDFIFSTIPVPDLIDFLQGNKPDEEVHKTAGFLEYLSMILVFVRIKRSHVSSDTWLYFPEKDLLFNRGYEAKNFDNAMGPEGESLLCLEITCKKGDEQWSRTDEEIKTRVFQQIVRIGLILQEDIQDAHLIRLTHAYPVYDLLYRQNLQKIWSYLENFPRLITLGRQGLFHHNNMDHSIYEGLVAADYYSSRKDAAKDWYREADQFRKLRIVD